jgi:Na+-driven multidrug efflux pump
VLTAREKRFIKYWEEQRKGGRYAYYLLYILGGTFIISLLGFILLLFILQFMFNVTMLWAVPVSAFVLAVLLTIMTWQNNERKFKRIIRREVAEAKDKEQ